MKITKSENKIEISVSPNRHWINTFVFISAGIVMLPFLVFYLLIVAIAVFKWNFETINFEILGMILLTSTILNYSLWLLIGKEKVSFDKNFMIYTITNGLLRKTKRIEISSIQNLSGVEKVYNSELPFIPDTGRIKFNCKGKYHSILRGLKNDEVKNVVEIFKEQSNKNIP